MVKEEEARANLFFLYLHKLFSAMSSSPSVQGSLDSAGDILAPNNLDIGASVSEDKHTGKQQVQDGTRLVCRLLCVPLLIPIPPSVYSKVFCLFASAFVPCSSSHSQVPFSPFSDPSSLFRILLFCHSDARNSVRNRYFPRGFRNREYSMPNLHLYVRNIYQLHFRALHSLSLVDVACTGIACISFMLNAAQLWNSCIQIDLILLLPIQWCENSGFETLISWRQYSEMTHSYVMGRRILY